MNHRQDGFQMAIVVNGNEQRIVNGNIYIPFGTEYAIRIRNNNNVRAEFKLNIDGTEESDSIIINANSTVTMERFLGGSLNGGNKYKFVSANDSRVQNPTSGNNGIIKVSLKKERTYSYPPVFIQPTIYNDWNWINNVKYGTTTAKNMSLKFGALASRRVSDNTLNCSSPFNAVLACNASDSSWSSDNVGATVEGSHSDQKFVNTNGFETDSYTTVLEVQLKGTAVSETVNYVKKTYCPQCGTKFFAAFCASCGTKR